MAWKLVSFQRSLFAIRFEFYWPTDLVTDSKSLRYLIALVLSPCSSYLHPLITDRRDLFFFARLHAFVGNQVLPVISTSSSGSNSSRNCNSQSDGAVTILKQLGLRFLSYSLKPYPQNRYKCLNYSISR